VLNESKCALVKRTSLLILSLFILKWLKLKTCGDNDIIFIKTGVYNYSHKSTNLQRAETGSKVFPYNKKCQPP
jgi:hypothetical protein